MPDAVDPYPALRLMGEIDWDEDEDMPPAEQVVRRAVDIGQCRAGGGWTNDDLKDA